MKAIGNRSVLEVAGEIQLPPLWDFKMKCFSSDPGSSHYKIFTYKLANKLGASGS